MEQVVAIKVLNEFFSNKEKYFVNGANGHQGIPDSYDEGMQGEYNETFKFYKHPDFPENVFWKETYHTDSYGDEEHLVKYEMVQGVEKTITVYEPI